MPQIPPNLYKLPGGKGYWFNPYPSSDPNAGSGVAHKISDPESVERIFGTNIPEREWGAGTTGWTPQNGGGTTGGAMPLATQWQMQPSVIHGDGLPPTPEQYAAGVQTKRPLQQGEVADPARRELKTDAQIQQEGDMQSVIERGSGSNAQNAGSVLDAIQEKLIADPGVIGTEIDDQRLADFLEQAKQEVDPYYKQIYSQGQRDLQVGLSQIGEDVSAGEKALEGKYGGALRNIQDDAAKRGLTFSTAREDSEKDLLKQTQAAIEEGRREAERRALSLGTKAERELGSTNIPQNLPSVSGAPTPSLGQPGVYNFQQGTGTRSLYNPQGGITGEQQYNQRGDIEEKYGQAKIDERNLRANYLYNQ